MMMVSCQADNMLHLRGEKVGFRLEQGHINDVWLMHGNLGQNRRHVGIAFVDRAFKYDIAFQIGKGSRHRPRQALPYRGRRRAPSPGSAASSACVANSARRMPSIKPF